MLLGEIQMRCRVYICSLFSFFSFFTPVVMFWLQRGGISSAISCSLSLHFCKIIAAFEICTAALMARSPGAYFVYNLPPLNHRSDIGTRLVYACRYTMHIQQIEKSDVTLHP